MNASMRSCNGGRIFAAWSEKSNEHGSKNTIENRILKITYYTNSICDDSIQP
jgi:hypothetical protein